MKQYFIVMMTALLLFSSCVRSADHTVDLTRETEPVFSAPREKIAVIINKNSMTFHLDADCSYLQRMKEENRMDMEVETLDILLSHGYEPCGGCAKNMNTEIGSLP